MLEEQRKCLALTAQRLRAGFRKSVPVRILLTNGSHPLRSLRPAWVKDFGSHYQQSSRTPRASKVRTVALTGGDPDRLLAQPLQDPLWLGPAGGCSPPAQVRANGRVVRRSDDVAGHCAAASSR